MRKLVLIISAFFCTENNLKIGKERVTRKIKVGIGDLRVATSPSVLITSNLGSCVGVALYDSIKLIGGLAHITLPSRNQVPKEQNLFKFADTAIPILIKKIARMGASPPRIVAKIAGGGDMFPFQTQTLSLMDVGSRNVAAVRESLRKNGIELLGEETRGNMPRSMEFNLANGAVILRTKGKKDRTL